MEHTATLVMGYSKVSFSLVRTAALLDMWWGVTMGATVLRSQLVLLQSKQASVLGRQELKSWFCGLPTVRLLANYVTSTLQD